MTDTSTITIPESLVYFFENEKNRQAVRTIMDQKKAPADLSWDDLEQFHLAKVAAEQVCVDYWRLSLQVWRATWGKAFKAADMDFFEVDSQWYEGENQASHVWKENQLYHAFQQKDSGFTLLFGVSILEQGDVQLSFYCEEDEGYDTSNNLRLLGCWKSEPDNDYRITSQGLASLSSSTAIDLNKLLQAANGAVDSLSKTLN